MSTKTTAEFEIKDWKEATIDEGDGVRKLSRANVTRTFSSGIDGSSLSETLMAYAPDGTASFVGLERVRGAVDGREGTFVLQLVGTYEDGAARGRLTVVRGSGTDDLEALTGEGDFYAATGPSGSMTLTLDLG
jgi:hypothetical protein